MMTPTFFACCLFLQSLTPEVIEHARAGAAAAQQGHLSVAIQEYRKVTELQPNSAVAHARLGEACFQNGDYAAAIPELKIALRLNPEMKDTHQTLGILLLIQGNAEEALPHLEQMRTPELLGLAYLETGRLGGAITMLHKALDKQPDDPNLLYYFGRATALAAKRSSDQLAGSNPAVARNNGAAADTGARPPQDVVGLQYALAEHPNDPDLLSAFSRKAAADSKQAFDRILHFSADSARGHQVLAERFLESGRPADAEREYVESLWRNPNAPGVHHALGDVLAGERKWSEAVTQYRMETQLQPLSADGFYSLGLALLQQEQARDAVEQLVQADRLRPETPQILLALGNAAFAAQDAARAEASWIKLLRIDVKSPLAAAAHQGLSTLYRRAGRVQEAEREQAAYEQMENQGAAK
jgi:tetratricopeptide (TPR) repeat protein